MLSSDGVRLILMRQRATVLSGVMEMSMKSRSLISFAVVTMGTGMLTLSAPAFAQYDYYSSGSFGFNQNNYPDLSGHKWKKPGASSTTEPTKQKRQAQSPTTQPSTQLSDQAKFLQNPLPYKRDMALAAKLRTDFLSNVGKGSSASRHADLTSMTAKTDFVQVFALMAKLEGLDTSTAEGLTALWYGQSWAIANQRPLPTARQYQGIAKQLRDTNANAMVWDKLDNIGRQTIVEMVAYPAVVQRATYEDYLNTKNTVAMQEFANRVQAGMLKFNMNMQSLRLTDAGFE